MDNRSETVVIKLQRHLNVKLELNGNPKGKFLQLLYSIYFRAYTQ